jgi:hypothetical protein
MLFTSGSWHSHQIKVLDYNASSDLILVISGNSQAKVIDREGKNVLECVKGDQVNSNSN